MNFIKITSYTINEGKTRYYDVYINPQDILTVKDYCDYRYIVLSKGHSIETFLTKESAEVIMNKIIGNYHGTKEQIAD